MTAAGIDLILLDVDFSAGGRPLTIMLISDAETLKDFEDDVVVYQVGATDVVTVTALNRTAGPLDLNPGTVRARVVKA